MTPAFKHTLPGLLLSLLVACEQPSTDSDGKSSSELSAPGLSATALTHTGSTTIARPSISAAQLANDATITLSDAQDQAAITSVNPLSVAAPANSELPTRTTDATNSLLVTNAIPSSAIPKPTETTSSVTTVVNNEKPAVTGAQSVTEIPKPVVAAATLATEPGPDLTITSNETPTAATTAEPSPVANSEGVKTNSVSNQTVFQSQTSAGFTGTIRSNGTVLVSWKKEPNARGYNVYRQAKYIKTVFTNEFIDEDIFDINYYYEIRYFTNTKEINTIATGLTVKVRGLDKPDPDPLPDNTELLKDYQLVFSDEFNGDGLDASKWNTSYLWGSDLIINSEEQYYVDALNDPDFGYNPFSFDGESLTINSIRTPVALKSKAKNQSYLSGVITSYDAFKFTYGYVEARARVPLGRGYWPAFWLLNAYYVDDKPEIDIMEFIGDDQDVVYHTYHYFDSSGELRSTKSRPTPGIDYSAEYHTYAVEWKPGTLTYFIDGKEVHRFSDPKVSQQEMYILANTAIGGWWAGSPDDSTGFPGKYALDYIRVYQKNGQYDDVPYNDGATNVPYADDVPDSSPNHMPAFEQWPDAYPEKF
ncbi:MAG: family 16 glycosylhydrolase [Granulosicoccus sp.]